MCVLRGSTVSTIIVMIVLTNFGLCDIPYKYTAEQYPTLTDCLLKILYSEMKSFNLVFIKEEIQEDKHVEGILKLNWDRIIVPSNSVSSISGLFILLPDSNTTISYKKIMNDKHLDYNSKYIICTENIRNVINLFEVAWEYKIIDVVALLPSRRTDRISVYTYFPYGPFGCSTTDPVRINIYEPTKNAFEINENLFFKTKKLSNLYKCPVRITVSDRPAEAVLDNNIHSGKGVSITLFNFLQQQLNFTARVVLIDREANTYAAAYYNFTSAVVLNIVKGESDLGVGRFSQLVDYHKDIDSPAQTSMDCFTWAVPTKAGTKPSVWTTSIYEFDVVCWVLIILSILIAILVFRFLNKIPFLLDRHDGLTIFATLLNVSANMRMKSHSVKVFVSCWLLYCFVITAAYSASLGSLVTVPPDSSDIGDSRQLLEKDFILTGEPKMYHILSASSETSLLIREILDRFVILLPGEFKKIIYKIYRNRSIAVFYTKSKLIQEESRVIAEMQCGTLVHVVPQCLITSHTSPIIMRKGSVLMEPVKTVVIRLLESGILNYWGRKDEDETAYTAKTAKKFTVSQLRGALIVTITGYIISSAAFAYEILSSRLDRKSSITLNQESNEKKQYRAKYKFVR